MSAPLLSQPERLDQMNRLEDMGCFPVGGAGRNVVHLLAV
jgi:hypothetical protein